jgi:hypothetical protein
MTIETEFEFILPIGYYDQDKEILQKKGSMRLARAGDEIRAAGDMRVKSNPLYSSVLILSSVVTKLGDLKIDPHIIESLSLPDFKYLVALYEKINGDGHLKIPAICPKCTNKFELDLGNLQ